MLNPPNSRSEQLKLWLQWSMATFLADVVGNTIALIPAILIGIGVNIGLETLSNTLGLESETDITVFAMNLLSSIVVSFVVGVVQSTAQFGLSRF